MLSFGGLTSWTGRVPFSMSEDVGGVEGGMISCCAGCLSILMYRVGSSFGDTSEGYRSRILESLQKQISQSRCPWFEKHFHFTARSIL